MNCSTPGLPVHHQLPEFTQNHLHRVSDAIQPSHPLSSPSPPSPIPPSIRVFASESTLHMRWPKYWRIKTHLFLLFSNSYLTFTRKMARAFQAILLHEHDSVGVPAPLKLKPTWLQICHLPSKATGCIPAARDTAPPSVTGKEYQASPRLQLPSPGRVLPGTDENSPSSE